MPIVTMVDVSGTQAYIFASNRLRDAVAGSILVTKATPSFTPEGKLEEGSWLADPTILGPGEVIISGGGTASLKFPDMGAAKDFAGRYSRRILDEAPGLEVVIVHAEYANGKLASSLGDIAVKLERAKLCRRPSVPLLGLGVGAACAETGLPATEVDDTFRPFRPVSAAIKARRNLVGKPQYYARWSVYLENCLAMLPQRTATRFDFPDELDDLGRKSGERSLIGIVHVDGNGIGAQFSEWIRDQAEANVPDDRFITAYQQLSRAVAGRFAQALSVVVERVCTNVHPSENEAGLGWKVKSSLPETSFDLKQIEDGYQKGAYALPIRPLVLGGDDLTFVCDGRIALDLAAAALSVFGKTPMQRFNSPIYASAGVAIIPSHSPFFRGYQLAESLCNNVKAKLKEKEPEKKANGIDWHIGILGSYVSLASYRERSYVVNGNQLTCRPYLIGEAETAETWQWFSERLVGPETEGSLRSRVWRDHHSKAKELVDVALEGPDAVKRALLMWQRTEPKLTLPNEAPKGFFEDQRTPLLDAGEILDIHWPLRQPEGRT